MKSNYQRMKELADDFYRLALGEQDGYYRGALMGIRSCASILEDDGLVDHVNHLLGQLKETKA